ncbi:hypothetical protein ACWDTQ_26535 [Streptomyces cellulosae]
MIEPFRSHPHYEVAAIELLKASREGKRELREAAYRIRDAYSAYDYAVNYGKPSEGEF